MQLKDGHLQKAMESIARLKPTPISKISRSLARFASTAGFKLMVGVVELANTQASQDIAAEAKVRVVTKVKSEIEAVLEQEDADVRAGTDVQGMKPRFVKVVAQMRLLRDLVDGIASLPTDGASKHSSLRRSLVDIRNQFEARFWDTL